MGPLLRFVLNRPFEEGARTAMLIWLKSAPMTELIGMYVVDDDRVDEELRAYIQDELRTRGQYVSA
jgi:hypothetical protein